MITITIRREDKIGTAEAESPMVWLDGGDILACLDWDEYKYELWFELDYARDFEWEELGLTKVYEQIEKELEEISVIYCSCLDEVNEWCAKYCGDNRQLFFYDDDLFGIIGCY